MLEKCQNDLTGVGIALLASENVCRGCMGYISAGVANNTLCTRSLALPIFRSL
jgi:hypothetical protein